MAKILVLAFLLSCIYSSVGVRKITILLLFPLLAFVFLNLFNSSNLVFAQTNNHVPGQILVKFKTGIPQSVIDRQLGGIGAKQIDKIDIIDVLILNVPKVAETSILKALSKNPNIEFAEFDYIATALLNDTYFSREWGLKNTGQVINGVTGVVGADIDWPEAWAATGSSIKIAILDTGINESHPDLTGKVVGRVDFSNSSSGTNDIYGHGNHVAGIVAASTDNNLGVAGVCPKCTLLNVKVLNDSGSGSYSGIAKGINWAIQNGAKVINMSLGGSLRSSTLESAVNNAWNNGVVVVAAAGNSNNPSKTYPGAYKNVIAVAATDNRDQKASFSSYGVKWVDIAAPGVYIFSTWKDSLSQSNPQPECVTTNECYKYASGTSMSTPIVSGVAGLVWSSNYGTSAQSVRNRIESTADKISGTGNYWSNGRVNAYKAVN
ncbi:peptidase S8 [Candidatus Gottesmanbacteria bacterium]|nr:peptidase S8 [Candidatus Gottesmanbacteria bacterium]